METRTQDVPGYYVWQVSGKPLVVHLHLDVIDALIPEVMRGFGAVRKRGVEVGGILIGVIEPGERGEPAIVRVIDFEPVECPYKLGPSYVFSQDDAVALEDACEKWKPDSSRKDYVVGYFRSHTRDGLALSPEDIEVMDRYFPDPFHVALLIKPFATKPSLGGFFYRDGGVFVDATPLEFPFRRRDLAGEEAPARRPLSEHRRERELADERALTPVAVAPPAELTELPQFMPEHAIPAPSPTRSGMLTWMPLSVVFLVLGLILGVLGAASMGFRYRLGGSPDFSPALTITRTGDNLTVRWNPEASAIRNAQHGVLDIEDGTLQKIVELDAADLLNGQSAGIVYHNTSEAVHFRLIAYMNSRLSVIEDMDWHR